MKMLKCVAEYSQASRVIYQPGAIIQGTPELLEFLVSDAPGCFEPYPPPEVKEVKAPPADKAVKRAPRSKRTRSNSK